MPQRTAYVKIRADDLAGLLLAALLLSTFTRINRAYRVSLLALHDRLVREAGLQLPPGREAVK